VRAASAAALGFARRHGVVRVLDIDYRPVLWGLTKRGAGENRFVADARVTAQLQEMLPQFEPADRHREEFLIAGGVPGDLIASLQARARGHAGSDGGEARCQGLRLCSRRGCPRASRTHRPLQVNASRC